MVWTTATAQTQTALDLLEGAGYTNINGYGYRASRTKSLNCTLTVCADNPFKVAAAKQIKEQLAAVNFNVRILELGYKDYTQAIANGEFEMYLGEIKIPANIYTAINFNTPFSYIFQFSKYYSCVSSNCSATSFTSPSL